MEERRDAIVCNDETKQIAKRNVTRTRLSANNLSDVRAQKRECSCVVISVCAAMAAPGSGQRATLPLGTEGEHPELRLSIFCSPRSPNKQGECTGKCRQFNGFGLVPTGSGPGGRWFKSTRPDHF